MALGAIALLLLPAASPIGQLDLDVTHLRSTHGMIRICLTRDPANFPGCVDDAQAIRRTISAAAPATRFAAVPQGAYALAIIHDENGNARLDTLAGIPREGVGFSRNPRIAFGPPGFKSARFTLGGEAMKQEVRVKYFL